MKYGIFGARILLAALLTVWLSSPARAQHGGGGGGSHGGGGGGGHAAGGGGGHAASGGGGHASGGGGVQGGGGMHAPASPSGGHAVAGVGSSLFVAPSGSPRSGTSGSWVGSSSWQAPPGLPATSSSAPPGIPSSAWQPPPAARSGANANHVAAAPNAWRPPAGNSAASGSSGATLTHPMLSPGRAGMAPGSLMTRPFPRRPPGVVVGMTNPAPHSAPGRFPFRGGCRFDPDCDGDIDFVPHSFFFGGFGFGGCPFWSWNCGLGFGSGWGWDWGWMSGFGYPGYGGGYYYPPPPPPPTDMSAPEEYGPFSYQYPPAGEGTVEPAPVVTTILVLKDGSTYSVTDYWLESGRLHYVTTYGGANDIPVEQLDLQRTVDENAQRGVTFTLRPAPAPQSPQDSPSAQSPEDSAPPAAQAPQNSPPASTDSPQAHSAPAPDSAQPPAAPDQDPSSLPAPF
jgi:hypothetical protein